MKEEGTRGDASSDQLRVLYDVTRRLATFVDLDDVVRFATRRAREVFDAEGCALILLDRQKNEFTFPVSSQRESGSFGEHRLAEIRFPADRGIAGWVVAHDEAALVEDTATDPRFYSGVDSETAMRTRSLLCAPLRSGSESIGVIEVINPSPGHLHADSLRFLETLGNEIAVAHEKAALYAQLRGEVINLRNLCQGAGLALALLGGAVGVATTLAHRARVLPWWELPTRRGALAAMALIAVGAILIAAARGWMRRA
jgi:GAF domain-containing protein